MNELRHDEQADIVDEATRALRETPTPPGPSPEALARTLAAVQSAELASPKQGLVERIRTMNRWTKLAAAAAVLLATAGGVGYVFFGSHGYSIAFADVKKQIQEARTVNFSLEISMPNLPKPLKMKMMFKSPGQMRQEMDSGITNIFDLNKGKGLVLIPAQKMAMLIDFGKLPPEMLKQMEKQMEKSDFVSQIKLFLEGPNKELGEKELGGVRAKGFLVKKEEGTMEIWVDAKTGHPLRIELETPAFPSAKMTMTNFQLNPELDDKLFSMDVPEGYKVQEQKFDFGSASEKDLAAGLGFLAKYNDGKFPEAMMISEKIIQNFQKDKPSEEKGKEMGLMIGRMSFFVAQIGGEAGNFHYAGKGVNLGDKDTPIAWWLPKGAAKCRVLYGDLRFEDVEPSKLPATAPASQPPTQPARSP